MLRVVLDVNVLVSAAFVHTSTPGRVVREWRAGAFEVVVSPRLLDELRAVLVRPHVERRVSSPGEAAAFVETLDRLGVVVDDPPLERFVPGDADDDYLVAIARAGRAQAIVTGDTHLLDAGIEPPAISPLDFLTRLEELDL